MKKKYIIIPIICVIILVAIIVCVAIALDSGYLVKLPYDHISDTVYNGVEIVGEDGLFYLVKDGKKVSDGYASLKSVNDFYGDIEELIRDNKSVTLFDYYIARTAENSDYLLVNSEGEEVMISGNSYTLDTENTRLPYLVFTNNTNGLKTAISLRRLDSDISYKAGNELTLRPFKSVTPVSTCESSAICTYLETEDISDGAQKSYFRSDGIKITTGATVEVIWLYDENDPHTQYPYFYNPEEGKIFSADGENTASGVIQRFRVTDDSWQYVLCNNEDNGSTYAVVFSYNTSFTLRSDEYNLSTLNHFGNCITVARRSGTKIDIIGMSGSTVGSYTSIKQSSCVLIASNDDGSYSYLNKNGAVVMTGSYGDMQPVEELCTEDCTVLKSAQYDEKNTSTYYHFARGGASPYTLDMSGLEISLIDKETSTFLLTRENEGKTICSVLAPFSSAKKGDDYDTISFYDQNGVKWLLAESYSRQTIDIVDPLTAKAVTSISCSPEDFARYKFIHDGNIALATDSLDADSAVHISIIRLEKYEKEDMLNSTKYFAVYRPVAHSSKDMSSTQLIAPELGSDLRVDTPYEAYTMDNYLIVHTATGSNVFSLDESRVLSDVANIPYHVSRVLTDRADPSVKYFVVTTESDMHGLYNTYSEEVLSPYYSNISSVEDGYIVLSMRGAYGVILAKSNGNTKTVIDFLYSHIIPTGNKGYYAINGEGKMCVYDREKNVLSKSIQSSKVIQAYSETEDGKISLSYWYVFSADARLYIHRSEQKLHLTFENYDCPTPSQDTPLNDRATVIYYYSEAKRIHTQIIYPTDSNRSIISSLYAIDEGQVWYISKDGSTAVTEEYFKNKHIIKLYSAS